MKKTCDGCKAFNIDMTTCLLKFKIKYPGIPQEQCPKPKTNKAYILESQTTNT